MRKILYIAWNDVRIEFSERSTIVFFLLLPLLFTAVIGAGLGGSGNSESRGDQRFSFLVVDQDATTLSGRLLEVLVASDVVRPEVRGETEAKDLFENEAVPALLTVPQGFENRLVSGEQAELELLLAPNDNRVLVIEQAVKAAARQVSDAVAAAKASVEEAERVEPFASEFARRKYFSEGLELAQEMLAEPPARMEYIVAGKVVRQVAIGFEQSSPGQLVTWVLITLIGASEVFVSERLGGTLRRLVVAPVTKAAILLGKIIGRLSMGIVQMALLVTFGAFVLGVDWGRSPLAMVAVLLAFALSAVAFGVMLATFARTRGQASAFTTLFGMLLAALGGAWWPLEITPAAYKVAVKVLPTAWAMTGLTDVIVRQQGIADVLPEVGVLLGFALLFFAVGAWRFRFE